MTSHEHQAMLGRYRKEIGIAVTAWTPTCTPWSIAGRTVDSKTQAANREEQMPFLNWMVHDIEATVASGDDAFVENPKTSDIWRTEPAMKLTQLGLKPRKGDQCRRGATLAGTNTPIEKGIRWESKFPMQHKAVPCQCTAPQGPVP